MLLGRNDRLMSSNQIIDLLKIVDIDDYRNYDDNKRKASRFKIRTADELIKYFNELIIAIKNRPPDYERDK